MENWLSSVSPRICFTSKSESICESEEFDKIEVLQNAGRSALSDGDGALALHFYNEAVEIDGANIESLCGRCLALLLTKAVDQARRDAVSVTCLAAENPRGYYLEALCLEHEKKYEDSLKVLLRAFELRDADDRIISDRILSVAQKCPDNESSAQPEDLTGIEVDDFERLSEAGKILLAAEKPELAVDVLSAAMKLDIKRTDAAVARQRLLIGQALAASGNLDAAVSSFQDCLKSCESFEDLSIIKVEALSQLAAVYTEVGDPLNAIICYEKVLDLENGSRDQSTGIISGSAFLCGIHLDLSIAYRSFGDLELARHYAQLAHSISETDLMLPLHSELQLNLGILAEAMGDYQEAVTKFEGYRKLCKHSHNENGLMTSYGCLGNVYSRLNHCHLAAAYHDRQVTLAHKSGKVSALALAKEMEGDSLVLLHRYPAAMQSYQHLVRICEDGSILSRVVGYFKLGRVFMLDNKDRYARFCFEKALLISADAGSSLKQLITQIELSLALILIDSDDQEDLETAKRNYHRQIQHLERELSLHSDHALTSHVIDLKMQLKECDNGLVCILSKMNNERDALIHVERLNIHISNCKPTLKVPNFNMEGDVINELTSIAEHLKCCVIYYFLLPKELLIWFLSAGGKVLHVKKELDENCSNVTSEAGLLMKSVVSYLSSNELLYSCENRALPLKQTGRQTSPGNRHFCGRSLVNQCLQLASYNGHDCRNKRSYFEPSERMSTFGLSDISGCDINNVGCMSQKVSAEPETDSAEQRLYDLLVLPIETILQSECVDDDHIIIVPCETLSRCPFWSLSSSDGVPLGRKYHVTVTGSLTVLNAKHESSRRHSQTGLDHRGSAEVEEDLSVNSCENVEAHSTSSVRKPRCDDAENLNPKHTSNPRLTVLSGCHSVAVSPGLKQRKGWSDVTPLHSSADVVRPQNPMCRVQDKVENLLSSLSAQKQKFVVIGSPSLPKCVMLDGRQSTLTIEENRMKTECVMVADLLGAERVIENDATKDRFLQELSCATVLHIATFFSPEHGSLAMTPNPVPDLGQQTLVDEALYLVQADEIVATTTSAKLVVISGGWSTVSQRGLSASQSLVSAFLSAGACCVLGVMYPVPSEVLACFYEGFYGALPCVNGQLSVAFRMAIDHVNLHERFKKSRFSSAFALIGVDTTIDMISVSQSMILHSITRAKEEVELSASSGSSLIYHSGCSDGSFCLTLSTPDNLDMPLNRLDWLLYPQLLFVPNHAFGGRELNLASIDHMANGIHPKGDNIYKVQQFLSSLVLTMSAKSKLLLHLIELLEVGSASSIACEPIRTSTILEEDLCKNVVAIKLLQFLGFTFQPPEGASISQPYVMVPCSDDHRLICICLDALHSLNKMSSDYKCLMAVQQLLPLAPSLAGDLSNLLRYYESNPNGEAKTSVQCGNSFSLWKDTKIRTLLMCLGFRCLDHVFYFRNTTKHRNRLREICRLLKLFVPSSVPINDHTTLSPVPCLGSRWATEVESSVRMEEKIQLSSRVKEENDRMRGDLDRAMTWHKAASVAQGRDVFHRKCSRPFLTRTLKVKVHGGATPSQTRIPVDREVIVDLREMEQRRDYAHFVYKRRLDQVGARHRRTVSNLILPHLFG